MADSRGFDLVTCPWISVLREDGSADDVSLADLFGQAGQLRAISGDLPTQDVAILRLSLAILQRALDEFAPASVSDVAAQVDWLRAHWDDEVVPEVTSYLDRFRDRFDLFHPTRPFFQIAGMHTAKGEVTDLARIIADMPVGSPYLTMRSNAVANSLTAAEAARWLVHAQAYDPAGIKTGVVGHPRARAGKVYPEGVAWTGQLGLVHLLGDTLRDTLLANLWAVLLDDDARGRDLPPWEREVQGLEMAPDLARRPAGPVDLYTWQPRRALLFGGPDAVTGVLLTYGDQFIVQERQGVIATEPMSLWRHSKPQTAKYKRPIQMPKVFQPGVALWRGVGSVLPSDAQRSDEDAAKTQLVEHAARIRNTTVLPNGLVRYRAVGVVYGSNNSVFDEVIEDALDLPSLVLDPAEDELRRVAVEAVESAWKAVLALKGLARSLTRAAGGSDDAGHGDRAQEAGYDALDVPYRTWLRTTLADVAQDPMSAEAAWHQMAHRLLDGLARDLVADVPEKAWVGFTANGRREDVGLAYERFRRNLRAALPRASLGSPGPPDGEETVKSTTVEESQ